MIFGGFVLRKLIKGEIDYVGLEAINKLGEDFVIDSVYCDVFDTEGNKVDSGSGEIKDNKFYFLIDTSKEEYKTNRKYYCKFTVEIEGKLIKRKPVLEIYITEF